MHNTPAEPTTVPDADVMFHQVDEHLTKAWAIAEVVKLVRKPDELLFFPMGKANDWIEGDPEPRLNFLSYAMWLQADELERAWRSLHAWWDARGKRRRGETGIPPERAERGQKGTPRHDPSQKEASL